MVRTLGTVGWCVAVAAAFMAMPAQGATVNAASCSQNDVAAAISNARAGDIVQVPAGSCSWSGLTIAKAVHVRGAGRGQTNITLSGQMTVNKQSSGVTRVSGFSFSRSGSGSATIGIQINGAWTDEPVVFQDNSFTVRSATLFRIHSPGGFIFANNSVDAGYDDIVFQLKDNGGEVSWQTADTLGNRDTTGKRNHYIETNTIVGGTNTTVDCDDGARCVYRYNTVTYSGFGSHGYATSHVGLRHFEVYRNTWNYPTADCSSQLANQNWLVRLRGGTGVVFDNVMPNIAAACGWGDKPEIWLDVRGAEDVRPQGSCANTRYPVPRQIGQNHNGSSYFTDPVYMWGNGPSSALKLGWSWGNPCGFNWDDFVRAGRDYVVGTAKPGYTPYTYPHPLTQGDSVPPPAAAPAAPVLQSVQ